MSMKKVPKTMVEENNLPLLSEVKCPTEMVGVMWLHFFEIAQLQLDAK